jgi:prolyl-tRNA editing enzyme YbaK/EbsC (Cys-tRNA(Pro) deacylase)
VSWPEPVQRVADFLRDAQAQARLEEFSEPTPTAEAAAKAAGVDSSQIVKSLVFVCDGRPVVAMIPGDRRADREKIARAVGAGKARFAPGGVAPFPLPDATAVLLDRSLLVHEAVWVGAGSENHMARLVPAELLRLTRARQMDAVEDRAYDSD